MTPQKKKPLKPAVKTEAQLVRERIYVTEYTVELMPIEEIAKKHRRSIGHIRQVLRDHKIQIRLAAPIPTDALISNQDLLDGIDLYKDGASSRNVALLWNCSQPTAIKILRDHGVKIRGRGGPNFPYRKDKP